MNLSIYITTPNSVSQMRLSNGLLISTKCKKHEKHCVCKDCEKVYHGWKELCDKVTVARLVRDRLPPFGAATAYASWDPRRQQRSLAPRVVACVHFPASLRDIHLAT